MEKLNIKRICLTCKQPFFIGKSRLKTAKFCKPTCKRVSEKNKKLVSKRFKGISKSKDHKKKISLAKISEKNPMWKGNKAGLSAIHIWCKYHKPKPKLCECCKINKPKDLANISQKYKRDINDFEWLCRKCHMVKDGRINNLKQFKNK